MIVLNIILGMIIWNMFISSINYKYGTKQNKVFCGLIGFSGKTNFKKKWIDLIIAWNSMKRGEDSTGLYSPLNGLKKSLDKGEHFILYGKNKYLTDKMFIGHVRHSTVGAKTIENAHPFERDNYILA